VATLNCFHQAVPAAVPGIVFLSGGQSAAEATANLNAINSMGGNQPWQLSFSFGRALQEDTLMAWQGTAANLRAAQRVFYHRSRCNSMARGGKYNASIEEEAD
jgi:fructose-bisphosphate aldolase class I